MTQTNYKISLEERLIRFDLLRPENIFGHCIHLSDGSIHDVNSIRVSVAHNTRSNMNNAVGYAPIGKLTTNVQLGTDGIGADMFAESKTAWFKYRDSQFDDARRVGFNPPIPASTDKTGGVNPTLQERNITPADVIQMLANSARRASKALGVTLGQLQIGAEADIVVTDYQPFSPITTENLPGHFLFAMTSRDVRDVLIAGTWRLRDRKLCALDEKEIRQKSVDTTKKLWERLEKI